MQIEEATKEQQQQTRLFNSWSVGVDFHRRCATLLLLLGSWLLLQQKVPFQLGCCVSIACLMRRCMPKLYSVSRKTEAAELQPLEQPTTANLQRHAIPKSLLPAAIKLLLHQPIRSTTQATVTEQQGRCQHLGEQQRLPFSGRQRKSDIYSNMLVAEKKAGAGGGRVGRKQHGIRRGNMTLPICFGFGDKVV
jgi:hypothetical protein